MRRTSTTQYLSAHGVQVLVSYGFIRFGVILRNSDAVTAALKNYALETRFSWLLIYAILPAGRLPTIGRKSISVWEAIAEAELCAKLYGTIRRKDSRQILKLSIIEKKFCSKLWR